MDKRYYKYDKIRPPAIEDVPEIVVECPSYDRIPHSDEEMGSSNEESDELGDMQSSMKNEDSQGENLRILERRSSISLPNLEHLRVEMENYDKSTDTLNKCQSEDDEFQNIGGTRNVRRKSVLSPRMLRPPGDDIENSPANSITSVNSIASLLREKLQSLPQTIREKKTPDYKTKCFVALLFITIVVLIVTSYCLYQQKVLAGAYFEKIKLNHVNRVMRIYDQQGNDVVKATLGTTLHYDKVLPCLPKDTRNDGSICLEWMHRARLYLSTYQLENNVSCYNLEWISLSESIYPTDCFDMTLGNWYGGGQTAESAWPLEKGSHFFHPFITGTVDNHEWGNVLKRYFINSKGAAIIIDEKTPLYISIRDSPKKELCLRAQYDDFAFVNRLAGAPHLNYSVCTGSNMSELHGYLSEHTLWDGLKKEDTEIIDYLLKEPVWEINLDNDALLTEEILANFTDDITNSVLKQGHVLINEFWQSKIGDFELDTVRFPTLEKTMEILKRRGFRVVFTIQPFISTESFNFALSVRSGMLVSERFSDRRIPALTRYKTLESAGVLDITSNVTVPWLVDKLKKVMKKYKFDAYYLDLGTAFSMPHYYQCDKALLNPDQYKTLFVNSLQGAIPIFGVNSAIQRPKSPAFVDLPKFDSSWDGLRRVIPTLLTYGILGYPFLIPGAVGGDTENYNNEFFTNDTKLILLDRELYIRWLQLAAFLPVIKFHHLPSSYGDKDISEMAKLLATIREQKVTPRLKKFARVSLNLGLPIMRPLWMIDSDQSSYTVDDQFSIGDEIIVAPILEQGRRERDVFLPAGVWRDGGGNMRKGNRWLHNYKVDEDEIPYFERMPDDIKY